MASGRTLAVSELGLFRFERAKHDACWPIEVRLVPQRDDRENTVYTLHTSANPPVPFTRTRREELRATLAVPPGALVYEVLRNGVLVSTGGLEVRPPQPASASVAHALRLSSHAPSGAVQLAREENGADGRDGRWLVRFVYQELPWTVREVCVYDDSTCTILTRLDRVGEGFAKTIPLHVGSLTYRFCVVAHDALQNQLAALTRLGWDDGAMVHASQLMTWPLTIQVNDLSMPGAQPADGLVRAPDLELMEKDTISSSLTTADDDDDDDDDDNDNLADHAHSADDNLSKKSSSLPRPNKLDIAPDWQTQLAYKPSPVVEDSTSRSFPNGRVDDEDDIEPHESVSQSGDRRHVRDSGHAHGFGAALSLAMGAAMFVLGSTVTLILGKRSMSGTASASDSLSVSDDASVQSVDSKQSNGRRKSAVTSDKLPDDSHQGHSEGTRSIFRPRFGHRS